MDKRTNWDHRIEGNTTKIRTLKCQIILVKMMADQLFKFVREVNSLSVFTGCLAASSKKTTSHRNKYNVFEN